MPYKDKEKYKKYQKKYQKKYKQSKKYKKQQKEYNQSEKGHFIHSQQYSRKQNLGFVLITDEIPDEPFDFHHINHNLVAPIPSDLHGIIEGQRFTIEQHRFYCYQLIRQLCGRNA